MIYWDFHDKKDDYSVLKDNFLLFLFDKLKIMFIFTSKIEDFKQI